MGYLKADARADLLLNATKKLMQSTGYGSITARKIAQESGAAIGHINRHFHSLGQLKSQAFLAIVHEKADCHRAASSALSGMDAVLAVLGDVRYNPREIELWREVSVLAQRDRALQEVFVYGLHLWQRIVVEAIERGIARQQLRCHDNAAATAWRLISMVLGQDSLAIYGLLTDHEQTMCDNLRHIIQLELSPCAAQEVIL